MEYYFIKYLSVHIITI